MRGDAALPAPTARPALTRALAISVVMPCHNAAATLATSTRCVLGQTHGNTELIFVDDGSSDDSLHIVADIAREFPDRVRLRDALIDADADLAYCGWQNVGPAAASREPFVPPAYETGDLYAECLRSCPWPIHAALVRREAVAAVGGFSGRMFTSMDYDFWLRLLAHTRRIVRVPDVMAFYYWHGRQISTDRSRQVLDAVQVRRDFVAADPECIAHLTPARRRELTDGQLLKVAYRAYWSRDLPTAHRAIRGRTQALRRGFVQQRRQERYESRAEMMLN